MPQAKLDIDQMASANPGIDLNLVRKAQALTAALPPPAQGAQYSLRRAFAERHDEPQPVVCRNTADR